MYLIVTIMNLCNDSPFMKHKTHGITKICDIYYLLNKYISNY